MRDAGATIEPLVRFIGPIIGRAVAVDTEKVSCSGMVFAVGDYAELRQQLDEAVAGAWVDLMERCVRPDLALRLCAQVRVSFARLARENVAIAQKFEMWEIVEKCAGISEDAPGVAQELEAAGWRRWAAAVWIAAGEVGCAKAIAGEEQEVEEVLRRREALKEQ
jgi:hypothetical protein